MKSMFSRTAMSLAMLAACSGSALAATVNLNGDLGTLEESATFLPGLSFAKNTAISFGWSFTVAAPYTSIEASINWTPNTVIPDFAGTLYSVSGCSTGPGGSAAGSCTTVANLASFVQNGSNGFNLPDNFGGQISLTPGTYAYYFTATTPDSGNGAKPWGFSGQTRADVPAPAALGLVGLGLLGMGLSRRRRA